MVILILVAVAFAVILIALARIVGADGFGHRPPPRSHHDEVEFDPRGMPLRFVGPR